MEKTAIELFAGVGGFRIGLNEVKLGKNGKAIEKNNFKFVWANQWEPSTKVQHAFDCYKTRFSSTDDSKELSNVDISLINKKTLPNFTLLTGGFPCQDYSVARSLSNEKGIEGKKGVLWWQINEIILRKKPPFVLLENVDRLLKSPSKQRGRDFGIMLRCFADNGYSVEWRVINAADYGHPQRRRRNFIFAYKNTLKHAKKMRKHHPLDVINKEGLFASQFPIEAIDRAKVKEHSINKDKYLDLVEVSNNFQFRFENAGFMTNYTIYTAVPEAIIRKQVTIGEILHDEFYDVDVKFFLDKNQEKKINYLKGQKSIERTSKTGYKYKYSEGPMSQIDPYDKPGRTMLTSEGSINRSSHIVIDKKTNKKRFITPIEAERLNEFPDNWTATMPDRRRYFMMGNALVTGVVKKIGKRILEYIENED